MDTKIKNFIQVLSRIRLTSAERLHMRASLEAVIRKTMPAVEPKIPSPYAGFFLTLAYQRAAAFLVLFAVAIGSVGTATFAAEDAVPGDAMYAVKTKVSEPLRSLAAVTPSAKAQWETTRAERRLQEAEILAARGELDQAVAVELSEGFVASADVAAEHIAILSTEKPEEATAASTELESVLSAHGRILDNILEARNGQTEERLAMLRVEIAEREEATVREREEIRIALVDDDDARVASERFSEEVGEDAEVAVNDFIKESETFSGEDAIAIDTRVAVITEAVDEGRAKHELGSYADALAEFAKARTAISVGKRLLEAKARFETDTAEEPATIAVEETANVAADAATTSALSMTMELQMQAATTTATSSEEVEAQNAKRGFMPPWGEGPRPIRIDLRP